ncbi:MAG: NAD(P)H-dependent oxidoreductase [Peptococcaceae bacterium]|nr:NAD(P)H-dependent oxidoreductase [Peptococcaceae bacterium]
MNILVINGSPKGEYSITLQTSLYLEQCFPEHSFTVLHAGQRIKLLERDFAPALDMVQKADLLLFSYPVYTFIAPSQLHRFIELLKASGINLHDKYATQITTSKHFYDVTAHRYIQDNCQDMGLKYIRGLSADMDDLLTAKGQKEARDFLQYVSWCVSQDMYETFPAPLSAAKHVPVAVPIEPVQSKQSGDVVIITDCEKENIQLQNMIARFQARLAVPSRIVNIREYPIKGGCLGCFNCAVSGKCVYTDGFDQYLRNNIQTADAMVFAFSIKDHSMGAVFKQYNDREFCNGHRTVTMGMPVGYLISGNYSAEYNLQMIIEARSQVGGNLLAGVATDEYNPNREIDNLAATLQYALNNNYTQPQNFYGVGGMKIFRDLIYLMQGMMKADHKFYKSHGQYDFPQKKKSMVIKMYLVGALLSNPKLKGKMGNKMNEGMIAPYKKILKQVNGKTKKHSK